MDILGIDQIVVPHGDRTTANKAKLMDSFSKVRPTYDAPKPPNEDDLIDSIIRDMPELGLSVKSKHKAPSIKSSSSSSTRRSSKSSSSQSTKSTISTGSSLASSTNKGDRKRIKESFKGGLATPHTQSHGGSFNPPSKDEQIERLNAVLGISSTSEGGKGKHSLAELDAKNDVKSTLIDHILEMREILHNANQSLDGIPEVTMKDDDDIVANVHEALEQKCERMDNCDIFGVCIEMATQTAEEIFDGKREIIGYKLNLTGWSNTVMNKIEKQKLRNDRIVRAIKKHYGIGVGFNLVFELVSSAFLTNKNNKRIEKKAAARDSASAPPLADMGQQMRAIDRQFAFSPGY